MCVLLSLTVWLLGVTVIVALHPQEENKLINIHCEFLLVFTVCLQIFSCQIGGAIPCKV